MKKILTRVRDRRRNGSEKKSGRWMLSAVPTTTPPTPDVPHQSSKWMWNVCVCACVCVSVGVCALSSPFSELSTLHGNSTWSFRPLPAPPLFHARYLCIFPNLDFLVRQQRYLSNTDLTLALTSTATSAAKAALLSSFAYHTAHAWPVWPHL